MEKTSKNLSEDHSTFTVEDDNNDGERKSPLDLSGGCIGIIIVFVAIWLLFGMCM